MLIHVNSLITPKSQTQIITISNSIPMTLINEGTDLFLLQSNQFSSHFSLHSLSKFLVTPLQKTLGRHESCEPIQASLSLPTNSIYMHHLNTLATLKLLSTSTQKTKANEDLVLAPPPPLVALYTHTW